MRVRKQGQIPGRFISKTLNCKCPSSYVLKCFVVICLVTQSVSGEDHTVQPVPQETHVDVQNNVESQKVELSEASSNLVSSSVPHVSSSLNSHGELQGFGDKFNSWGSETQLEHHHNDDEGSHHLNHDEDTEAHMFSPTEDIAPEEVMVEPTAKMDHNVGNESLIDTESTAGADKRRGILSVHGRPFIPIFTKHTKVYEKSPSNHHYHKGWGGGEKKRFKRRPYKKKCRRCRRGHGRFRRKPKGWSAKGYRSHSPHHEEEKPAASSSIFKNPFSFLARGRRRRGPRGPRGKGPHHRRTRPYRGYRDDEYDYENEDDKPFVIKNKLNLNLNLVRGQEDDEENEDGGDDDGPEEDPEEHEGRPSGRGTRGFGPFKGGPPIVIGGDHHHDNEHFHPEEEHHNRPPRPRPTESSPPFKGKGKGESSWKVQMPDFDFGGGPFKGSSGHRESREHFDSDRGKSRFPGSINDIMDHGIDNAPHKPFYKDRRPSSHGPPRGPPPHHEDGPPGPPPGFFDGPPGPHPYDDEPHHPFGGPHDDGPPPPRPHGPPPPPHHHDHEPEYHHEPPGPLHPPQRHPGKHHYRRPGKPHHSGEGYNGPHDHRGPASHFPTSYSEEEHYYENEGPPRPRGPPRGPPRNKPWHNKPPPYHESSHEGHPDHHLGDEPPPPPDGFHSPRRPFRGGSKSRPPGYYGGRSRPRRPPHGPPGHHDSSPEYHGPPHSHGPPGHHDGSPEYHGPPHSHGPSEYHEPPSFHGPPTSDHQYDEEPVFLPPTNSISHGGHDDGPVNHHPPNHGPPRPPRPHSSSRPFMESPDTGNTGPPYSYETEVIHGSPHPSLEDNNNRPRPNGFNDGPIGPSKRPPRFHSTGQPPRLPPRPPANQLPHYDQVLHGGNNVDSEDSPHHPPPSHSPHSIPPPPPPTHYSKPPLPPRSPKPSTFFASPTFNSPPPGPPYNPPSISGPPRRPHFRPQPVSYSNQVHDHSVPLHHNGNPRPGNRRPRNRPPQHHHPNSIQGIINHGKPFSPLLEGPRPTAQYHSPGSAENAHVVYGKQMHGSLPPQRPKLTMPIPFKPIPSHNPPQQSSEHYHQQYKPQPIKYGSYQHPHGALYESDTSTLLGSMKKMVNKLNPFGISGNHSSTSQSQEKPVTFNGYKHGNKYKSFKKNPYKLSNSLYHQPMAGLLVKPLKPGKAPKYSTLPQPWEHFPHDPTHSTLPKLTTEGNQIQNSNKAQMRLKKRNPFDGRAMTKFTAADAVGKPTNLEKRNDVEDNVSGFISDEKADRLGDEMNKPVM